MNKFTVGAIGVVFAAAVSSNAIFTYGTADKVTFTVTDKERIVESEGEGGTSSKYLIYSDNETFENTDTLWHLKYDSSDLYGKLKKGQTYEADVYGWRVGWMSMYRNIVDATPVNTSLDNCKANNSCISGPNQN